MRRRPSAASCRANPTDDRVAPLTLHARPIERHAAQPLVARIGEQLQEMITSGVIAPGDKLNELQLSRQFGVSRTALREAVRLLERSGLVLIIAGRGVFVCKLSIQQALDLFDIRAGLAQTAGRLAAARATQVQLAALAELHAQMVAARAALDFALYFKLNGAFHGMIFTAANNDRLAELNALINNELTLFNQRNMERASYLDTSIQEHGRILAALQDGAQDRAARAFERHVLGGRGRMLDLLPSAGPT